MGHLSEAPGPEELRMRILSLNVDAGRLLGAPSKSDLWDALDAFDDVTLDAIGRSLSKGAVSGPFITELLLETGWTTGREVRDALAVAVAFVGKAAADLDPRSAFSIGQGLKAYCSAFDGWVPGELHGRNLSIAQALARVTWLAYSPYEEIALAGPVKLPVLASSEDAPGWHLSDPELVALLAAHADRADEIVEFVRERRGADAASLRTYLGHPSALRAGAL